MATEKKWIITFFVVIMVWFGILFSTLYQWANGVEVLVDDEYDLSYITLPLMGFAVLYSLSGIFIFAVYLLKFNTVEKRQQQKFELVEREKERERERYIRAPDTRMSGILERGNVQAKEKENLVHIESLSTSKITSSEHLDDITLHTDFPNSRFGAVRYIFDSNITSGNATDRGHNHVDKNESLDGRDKKGRQSYYDELCSIVIPSRNEESVIRKTIQNCLLQTYENIEVVVICHNCTDRTFEEASQLQDPRVRVFELTTKEAGKGIALNYGVDKAAGNYILILDGDGRLSSEFIEKAMPIFFTDSEIAGVQGRYIPSNRNYNFITKLLSIEGDLWSTPYMTTRSVLSKKVYLGGTGFIIRKDVLNAVGKFTNHLVDDYELSCRLFKKNFKVEFAPLSIDYDEKPPSLSIMIRQRARWAKGFLNLLKSRAVKGSDLLGSIYWLSPLASLAGILVLGIFGYATIHNIMYDYYPYKYTYIPLNLWFALIGTVFALQFGVLVKEYGRKGLRYAPYLVFFNPFSLYTFVTYIKAIFVKSWGETKTAHGFMSKSSIEDGERVITTPD
ncbi:MAG TPA: glycosyltransferase family 2 protein [Nitrososphaeraceae archaeon]|nr:glycosyltransferase family 2 protein [Nitrososphaeraceae archaeon]